MIKSQICASSIDGAILLTDPGAFGTHHQLCHALIHPFIYSVSTVFIGTLVLHFIPLSSIALLQFYYPNFSFLLSLR